MVGALLTIVVPACGDEPARTEVVWYQFDDRTQTGDIVRALEYLETCQESTRLQ
jgi:hypothetical protein